MRQSLEKERILKLTLAVYRVTAIFPAKEDEDGLGFKIRESADKILADFILREENNPLHVQEILELFSLAEKKNLVNSRNFLVLRREYEKISPQKIIFPSPILADNSNNNRLDKIIEAINGSGIVKIGNLMRLFPGVNRRTVLRDLDKLCQTGVMVRNGTGRGVYYIKNGHKCDIAQEMSQ